MLRKPASWIACAALALTPAFAVAQDWYGALHVGKGWKRSAHVMHTVKLTLPDTLPWEEMDGEYDAALDYDSGWSIGAAVGRTFGDWRLEGELGYRASKIDHFEGQDVRVVLLPASIPTPPGVREAFEEATLAALNDAGSVIITGRAELLTGALNLYYDLPVEWAVRPYVGVGVGILRANKKKNVTLGGDLTLCPGAPATAPCVFQTSTRSAEWETNWHAMAGAKYAINERWEAALGWRYTDLGGVSFVLSDGADAEGPTFLGGDPLVVRKKGMHGAELTLIRRF